MFIEKKETKGEKNEFINRAINTLVAVAVLSLPITFMRIENNGPISIFGLHLLLISIVIVTALFRNKLSENFKSTVIIFISASISVSALFTFGFMASGIPWLLITLMFIFTLCPKYIRISMFIAIVVLSITAYGFISGLLTSPLKPDFMLVQPTFWLGLALPTLTFMNLLLCELDISQKRLKNQKSKLQEYNDSLKLTANHDHLTGVLNRRGFEDTTAYLFNTNEPIGISVIAIDIDFFKNVNDTWGHDAGDLVLVKFSEMLKSKLRSKDILCRFGGEEFIAITMTDDYSSVSNLCERLRTATENMTIQLESEVIHITASFGVTISTTSNSLTRLLRNSDKALYQAKEQGRNCIVFDKLA